MTYGFWDVETGSGAGSDAGTHASDKVGPGTAGAAVTAGTGRGPGAVPGAGMHAGESLPVWRSFYHRLYGFPVHEEQGRVKASLQ